MGLQIEKTAGLIPLQAEELPAEDVIHMLYTCNKYLLLQVFGTEHSAREAVFP